MRCDAMQCGLVFTCVDVFTHSRSLACVKRFINHVTDQQDEDVTLCFSSITAPCLLIKAERCGWRSAAKSKDIRLFFYTDINLNIRLQINPASVCNSVASNLHHIFGGSGVVLWCFPFTLEVKTQSDMDVSIADVSFVSPYPHTTAHYSIVCAWEHKNHLCTGRRCTILSV